MNKRQLLYLYNKYCINTSKCSDCLVRKIRDILFENATDKGCKSAMKEILSMFGVNIDASKYTYCRQLERDFKRYIVPKLLLTKTMEIE